MSQHSRRATAALRALSEADPALAALALWCRHRDDDNVTGAAETQGAEIRYGPAFEALAPHEQIGLAGHHVLHVSLEHSARMSAMALRLSDGFAPDLWQIACDAIVNEAILAAGHALPRPALTLSTLLERLGEGRAGSAVLADWECERLYHRLAQSAEAAGRVRRATRDQGVTRDLRPESGADRGRGSDTDSGITPDRAKWRAHLTRALAVGRAAGFGLGAIGQPIGDLPQSRTPWEVVLRRLLARATLPQRQPNPFRPARQWLGLAAHAVRNSAPVPPWQPRLSRQGPQPRVVIALDCSGSIPSETLQLLMAEATGIARRMQSGLHLLVFDEEIRIDRPLDPARWRAELGALGLPQGGGTNFAPILARAASLDPSAFIILTDMDGPTGPERPRFPVIWAAPQTDPPEPPVGRVLSIAR